MKNFIIPFNNTYELGKGLSSLTGEAKGSIFTGYELEENVAATGQKVEASLIKIESSEKLYESLNIDVELSASYGLFSADAKFGFASDSNINSHSIYYLYKVRVQNAVKRIKKLQFDPFAIQLLNDGKTEIFSRKYGDSFIEGIITGGEFFALYELKCQDESSKQKISAELDASYGAFGMGGDLNVKFSSAVEKASKKSTLSINIFQTGGKGNAVVFNPNEIAERAKNFPSIVQGDAGVAYEIIRASYETLPLPDGPNFIEIENRKEALNAYAKDIIDLRKKQNDLKYILLNPWEFEYTGRTDNEVNAEDINKISDCLQNIQLHIRAYTKHASVCADSSALCEQFVYKVNYDLSELPKRIQRLTQVILFDEKNYTGKTYYLPKGEYPSLEQFSSLTNDSISSIKIPIGFKAILCELPNGGGLKQIFDSSESDLSLRGLDNSVSSIVIFEDNETVPPTLENPFPIKPIPPTSAEPLNKRHLLVKTIINKELLSRSFLKTHK